MGSISDSARIVADPSTNESRAMRLQQQLQRAEDSVANEIRLVLWRQYNESEERMEITTVDSISILVGREEDGRWWADIESMPGVMAYGSSRESAITAVRALALRVAADCIDHGEAIPEPFTKVFSIA